MKIKDFFTFYINRAKKYFADTYRYWINVRYIMPQYKEAKIKCDQKKYKVPEFYEDVDTVDMIINNKMSLSRYGDGEFGWMAGKRFESFQNFSEKFAEDLRKAFCANNPRLLIGIPKGLFYTDGLNVFSRMFWTIIKASSYDNMEPFLDYSRTYVNASITRPYIDYNSRRFSTKAFANIKRIWDKRDVVIVEGDKSKLGIGNDLFNNALSIKRILCPSVNAYDKIEDIRQAIYKYVRKDELILGALGPTASILASELSYEGYQFVDIGHIDIEYMWYLKHSILRDSIPGKYVNESKDKISANIYDNDPDYINSIIVRINE